MAGKIRGITIELGADTSEFTKGLKSANSSIKDTQKQLKDVDKLLKLDPKNVDLMRQKQELLAKAVDETKDKLKLLKDQQASMSDDYKNTEEGQRAYDALQREIVETEQALNGLEKELKNSDVAWQQFQANAQAVSDKAGEVADKTRSLSAAAGAMGAAMLANAVNTGVWADDLNTFAQQTGFTTEEIQKFQYAADRVDVSFDSIRGAAAKMTKQLESSPQKFEALGVAVYNTDGSMRGVNEIFFDTLQALSQVENGTQRDVLAMEIFGKSANDLAGIVDDGGAALQMFGQEAEDAGLILSQDAVDAANQFNDKIDELKAKASQAFLSAGAALADELIPAMESLVEVVTGVLQWFANLDGTTQALILTILGVVAAISPIAGIISTISGAAAALNMAMLPTIGTIAGIVAGVALLVAGGIALYKNWDTIKAKAKEIWNNVKTVISGVVESIRAKWEGLKSSVSNIFNSIYNTIKGVVDKIKGVFNFNWSLPKLKLPHVRITGSFSLIPPSVPKFSIDWYAKAMKDGMILNSPTIFGIGNNGHLLAGGEAGSETVVGTNSLMNMIREATGQGMVVNMTVNAPEGMDVNQLADLTIQKLNQSIYKKGAAWR